MATRWSRKRKVSTMVLAVLVTLVVAFVATNFVRPEKSLERTIAHRYTIDDTQFRREMSVMMGPAVLTGNHVTALQNGDAIFPAMLAAIRAAQASITFETFIYWSGEIGRDFAEALSERARTGVHVNVMIDWVGSDKMEAVLLSQMEEAGVRVHRYRPLRWYNLLRMNNRTHRKILVVDGTIGFTGGVGIADLWGGNATGPEHWRDTHYRIEGPVVAQMQAAFNDNWIRATGQVLNGPKYFAPLDSLGTMDAHMVVASPSGGSEHMHLMYLMAIAAAEHSVDLSASYFVPDDLLIKAMVAARKRNVRVRVLLPGAHIDSKLVRVMSKASWGPLLQAGVEIYEYQPTMLHAKLLVIDRLFVSVGSTNFDIRSFRLNDEASLNVYDVTFAQQLTDVFERDLIPTKQYSYEMWKARPLKMKVAERVLWPIKSQL